jgi:hypothetical protein
MPETQRLTRDSAAAFLRQRDAEIAATRREEERDARERAASEGRQTWAYLHALLRDADAAGYTLSEELLSATLSAWVSTAFGTVVVTEEDEEGGAEDDLEEA